MKKVVKKYTLLLGSTLLMVVLFLGVYFSSVEIKNALLTGEIIESHGNCRGCSGPRYYTTEHFPSIGFNMTFATYLGLIGFLGITFLMLLGYVVKIFSNGKVIIKYLSEPFIGGIYMIYILFVIILMILGMVVGAIYA